MPQSPPKKLIQYKMAAIQDFIEERYKIIKCFRVNPGIVLLQLLYVGYVWQWQGAI